MGPSMGPIRPGMATKAHGADEFRFRKGPDHGDSAHGHHHGPATALQDAARNEDVDVGSKCRRETTPG